MAADIRLLDLYPSAFVEGDKAQGQLLVLLQAAR